MCDVCAHDIRNASKIDKIIALIIRIILCCQHKHGHGSSKTYQQITKISNWHHIYFLSLTNASGSYTHIHMICSMHMKIYVLLTTGITSTLLSSFKLKVPRRLSGIHSLDFSIFSPPIIFGCALCIRHKNVHCAFQTTTTSILSCNSTAVHTNQHFSCLLRFINIYHLNIWKHKSNFGKVFEWMMSFKCLNRYHSV